MHTRVHPAAAAAAARQPHVAYTDHVNTSWSTRIVVFYGELDFSPSVEGTRALLRCGKNCLPRSSATYAAAIRLFVISRLRVYVAEIFVVTPQPDDLARDDDLAPCRKEEFVRRNA